MGLLATWRRVISFHYMIIRSVFVYYRLRCAYCLTCATHREAQLVISLSVVSLEPERTFGEQLRLPPCAHALLPLQTIYPTFKNVLPGNLLCAAAVIWRILVLEDPGFLPLFIFSLEFKSSQPFVGNLPCKLHRTKHISECYVPLCTSVDEVDIKMYVRVTER